MIIVRAIEETDLDQMKAWRNELVDYCREFRLINNYHQDRWWREYCEQAYEPFPRQLLYALLEEDKHKLVGIGGWTYIDWRIKSALLSLYIGTEFQGNGYGLPALLQLTRIAFEDLMLGSLRIEAYSFSRINNFAQQAGYEMVGVLPEHAAMQGNYYDVNIYQQNKVMYFDPYKERPCLS